MDQRAPSPSIRGEDSNTLKVVLEKVHEVLGLDFFDFIKLTIFYLTVKALLSHYEMLKCKVI